MKMPSTQDCQGVARALMAVAADPSRTDELYGVLGEFCHGVRDHLNALKISLYVANQSPDAEFARSWREVHEQYLGVEQFVDQFQTVFRPMSLNLMSVSLGRLLEENRETWERLVQGKGATLVLSRPKTDRVGTFDPMRLADALERFMHWRATEIVPGTVVHLSWATEGDLFRIAWEERAADGSTERPPGDKCRVGIMALPMLARVMALHGGVLSVRPGDGCAVELRWPIIVRDTGDGARSPSVSDAAPLVAREQY